MSDAIPDLLLTEAAVVAGVPVTWLEVIGFVAGVWCVWLTAKEDVRAWPVGIVQVTAYIVLFYAYGLYADSLLQGVYIALGIYGWISWTRRSTSAHGAEQAEVDPVTPMHALRIRAATLRDVVIAVTAVAVMTAVFWTFLSRWTTSTVGLWDALTTALSLVAVMTQARKVVQSWWLWIIADVIYIPLYASKGLWLTAGLYVIFLALCVYGLREWSQRVRELRTTTVESSA